MATITAGMAASSRATILGEENLPQHSVKQEFREANPIALFLYIVDSQCSANFCCPAKNINITLTQYSIMVYPQRLDIAHCFFLVLFSIMVYPRRLDIAHFFFLFFLSVLLPFSTDKTAWRTKKGSPRDRKITEREELRTVTQ